jgi:hypothetical protein
MNFQKNTFTTLIFTLFFSFTLAQTPVFKEGLKFNFNEQGTNYLKLNFVNQVWIRFNESNPGTMVNKELQDHTFDIGIRRLRLIMQGYLTDRVYLFVQFGQNNLSYLDNRKAGAFFHDANVDYYIVPKKFAFGTGLASWGGVARYSAPTVSGIVGMDAPIYQQFTNDVNDQFLRRLSVYTHGLLGKFSYRLALSKPMDVAKTFSSGVVPLQDHATFSPKNTYLMTHGYFKYHFWDTETEDTGYHVGTHWSKKKMLTLGAGFAYQPDAVWYGQNKNQITGIYADTTYQALKIFSTDVFFEMPLSDKGNAISLYGAWFNNDYGKNYVRNVGVMNPANAVSSQGTFNGTGNFYPMQGTGNAYYLQGAYLCPRNMLGEKAGTLVPYFQVYYGDFKRFKDPMIVYDLGINWAIHENKNKITLNYQSRPIFDTDANGDLTTSERKAMWVLQYQIAF